MKISIVTGSYPPDVCGVGDYSFQLVIALKRLGIKIDVITHDDWSFKNIYDISQKVSDSNSDLLHIQYPTIGFGYSLLPQALCFLRPSVITLHEFSQANPLRKLSLYPFTIGAKRLLFTSNYEYQCAMQFAPWIEKRVSIIPIGSNIPTSKRKTKRNNNEIVYFGLIRPNKGLEKVQELATKIYDLRLPYVIKIIGNVDPRYNWYIEKLRLQMKNLPVVWEIGLNEIAVADMLGCADVAYLPFPDGVSERRGSLLAVMANAVPTVTTKGKYAPSDLMDCVAVADNVEDVLRKILELLHDDMYRNSLVEKGCNYVRKFSWNYIASQHVSIYQSLLYKNDGVLKGE